MLTTKRHHSPKSIASAGFTYRERNSQKAEHDGSDVGDGARLGPGPGDDHGVTDGAGHSDGAGSELWHREVVLDDDGRWL